MCTARSLTVCHACPPPAMHAPLPRMPPATHPPPAMHAPLPCTPPAMHTPCHAHPCHTCPPAMHTPCHACPPATHAPPPWTEFLTHASENITLPQLRWRAVNIHVSVNFIELIYANCL